MVFKIQRSMFATDGQIHYLIFNESREIFFEFSLNDELTVLDALFFDEPDGIGRYRTFIDITVDAESGDIQCKKTNQSPWF